MNTTVEERYVIDIPTLYKDEYQLDIHITGTPENPEPSMTIWRAEQFEHGKYPSNEIIASHDKFSWGSNHCAEADAIIAEVWTDEIDGIIKTFVKLDAQARVTKLIKAKQEQLAEDAARIVKADEERERLAQIEYYHKAELANLITKRNSI